jgi:hypothetical protein
LGFVWVSGASVEELGGRKDPELAVSSASWVKVANVFIERSENSNNIKAR